MSALVVAPVLIPAGAAVVLLVLARLPLAATRALAVVASVATLACAGALAVAAAGGTPLVHELGNWPPPYGIVLVVDRLAALMLVLTGLLALGTVLYALAGWDARGPWFHPLLQVQVMGLNGAFVTGDLFNLFVFFEVLLIASYCLLLHGLGALRLRAALQYVTVNLTASALFLIAAALLYGVTGTLNFAHLSARLAVLTGDAATLGQSGALLLAGVFAIKAAAAPLHLWLPQAYGAAAAPVAVLFGIMTKVGIYALARVGPLVFEPAGIDLGALLPAGLATLVLGTVGALAARRLGALAAYLTVGSVGTLLTALAVGGPAGLAAALYYMAHSVLALGALFLLAELIGRGRGPRADTLLAASAPRSPGLALLFLLAAASVAGIPPLAGFIGKLMLLEAAAGDHRVAVWATVLATGLFTVIASARAGSALFWRHEDAPTGGPAPRVHPAEGLALATLLGASLALAVLAAPVSAYLDAAAAQLLAPADYTRAVLGADTAIELRPLPGPGRP